MVQDVDNLQLGAQSYLRSENGRVIFNEDGTYAWENAKGTKFAFNLDANYGLTGTHNYKPIGGWQINGKLVIFSCDSNGHSEIGLVYEFTFGNYTYQTIFNDLYDPYANKLGFSLLHQMRDCQVVVENNETERIYFNDDFNEPRVFNVLAGLQSVSPQFTSGDYNPIGGFVPTVNFYPSFYSVHGMASMIDLTWGKLKYDRNITGSLLSGEYQYAYRYIHQSGYVSPWSPLSAEIFLTTDKVTGDWTHYQMQQSGAQTDKGIQLELKYIDQRFQQVEVAALYWQTKSTPLNAYTFFKGTVTGSSMIITHQFTGAAITIDELVQRYTEIKHAKTGGLKDNTYHQANLETFPNLEIDTSIVSIEPITRPMLSDEYAYEVANTFTPPFTNQSAKLNALTENMADGLPEVYNIYNDYINYKGTQWTTLFKGNFGGETYPFAIVVFDRKGQPFFAQHLSDFTLPQRYSNEWKSVKLDANGNQVIVNGTTGAIGDYKHTNNTNGTVIIDGDNGAFTPIVNYYNGNDLWYLNILGIKVSGIYFPDNVLYDTAGNLQVSGFSIVRTDRIKTILAQGVVMSATSSRNNSNTQQQFFQLGTMFNGFIEAGGLAYNNSPFYQGVDFQYVGKTPLDYSGGSLPTVGSTYNNPVSSARTQMAFFESPDYMIDNTILSSAVSGDNMKVIDVCGKAYGANGLAGQQPADLQFQGYYVKNYRTTIQGFPNVLTEYSSVTGVYNNVIIGDQVDITTLYSNIQSGAQIYGIEYSTVAQSQDYLGWGNYRYLSNKIKPTCAFTFGYTPSTNKTVNTFGVLTDDESGNIGVGSGAYMITNYIRPAGQYTITPALLESRIYNNIGHFVPINAGIINTVKGLDPNNHCVFNNVPVWGGDCFLDYWTYYRLYADLDQVNGTHNQDYNIGLSFPIESTFNIALRQGNDYERFGGTSAHVYNGTSPASTIFGDGLYYLDSTANKPEDFNVNNVLQAVDTITKFYPKPSTFNEIYDFPVREQYTGTKIYGEKYDTYRKFPVNNFRDADGSKGEINSLQNIFNYLYIIQKSGFARVRFNDRELITGQTGSSLDIGTGLGLAGFDYISNVYGTENQFSVINTGKMIHWLDAQKGKHLRFAADGLACPSDLYGLHNFFTNKLRDFWIFDNPLFAGGVSSVFDFTNQSVYFTFIHKDSSKDETIEYSEIENQYKGFPPTTPKVYFNLNGNFYSSNPSLPYKIYAHDIGDKGMAYDSYVNSKLKFVANPKPIEASWFDNISLAINNQVASGKLYSISAYTENQTIQTVLMQTDTRWRYLQGFVRAPLRGIDSVSRLRGKSAIVEVEVINDSSNTTVRLSSSMIDFRLSPKL